MDSQQPRRTRSAGAHAAVLGAVVFVLSLTAVWMRPPGSDTAVWWPAAGFAVAWVARRGRPGGLAVAAVVVGAAVANLVGGRTPGLALAFGVANGTEVLVASWWITRRGPARLESLPDLGRFLVGAAVGALAAGAIAAVAVTAVLGGSPLGTLQSVAVTHAGAVLLLAPVALVARDLGRRSLRGRLELGAQWVAVVALTALVFQPDQILPVAFLPLPALVWTAVRSGARTTAAQVLVVGVLVTAASLQGFGPFGNASADPGLVARMVQLYVLVISSTLLVLALDVRQRGLLARTVAEREALYRSGFSEALVGMLLVRFDGHVMRVMEVNGVGAALLGRSRDQLIGTALRRAVLPEDLPAFESGVLDVVDGAEPGWRGEVRIAPDGVVRWLEVAVAPSGSSDDLPVLSVQLLDVTQRRADREALEALALHDGLTGLPNRLLLDDRLEHALAGAARTGSQVGVVYLDLDGFKAVNDTAGHAVGDDVLVQTAARLRAVVRPGDTVARLGGDEFAVVCPVVGGEQDAHEVAARICAALTDPLVTSGGPVRVGVSAGVAVAGAGVSAAELIHRADTAMYERKSRRRRVAVG